VGRMGERQMSAFDHAQKSQPEDLLRCSDSPRRSRWSTIAWRSHWSRPPSWSLFPWKPRWPRKHHRWPRGGSRRWPAGCTIFRELDVVNGNISKPAGSPDPDKFDGGQSRSGTQWDDGLQPLVSLVTALLPRDCPAHLNFERANMFPVHVVPEFHLIFPLAENQWSGGEDRRVATSSWE